VWPREKIKVRVWVPNESHELQYTWSAGAGRTEGQGPEASWDFTDVEPGSYTATVTVSSQKQEFGSCVVRVIVLRHDDQRGFARETGSALLVGEKSEAVGYGLYSYVLFATPPDDSSRERYTKAAEAYLSLIPDVTALEKYLKLAELNVTYLPVDADPPHIVSVAWMLQHYNYARALVLLRAVPGRHRDGPYIISSRSPLAAKPSFTGEYLFQDLTSVPPHLIGAWVKQFLNQAAQEHFWEGNTTERLALKLRTGIGILAIGLPEVQKALNDWIAWRGSATTP
jgi:hypothetical protein